MRSRRCSTWKCRLFFHSGASHVWAKRASVGALMLSAEKPPITEGSSLLDFPTMVSMVLALSERLATFRSVGRSDLDRRSFRHLIVHIEPRASGV